MRRNYHFELPVKILTPPEESATPISYLLRADILVISEQLPAFLPYFYCTCAETATSVLPVNPYFSAFEHHAELSELSRVHGEEIVIPNSAEFSPPDCHVWDTMLEK